MCSFSALVASVELSLIAMPVILALSVSFGVMISVYCSNSLGISSTAGAGFKIVIFLAFLAILNASSVTSSGISN